MFFYGTLCDLRLCEIVLGRSRDQMQFSDALLHDHAVYWARGQNFPVIVREQGSTAKGLLLTGLDQTDIDKLDYYESGFDYAPVPVTVETDAGPQDVSVYYCDDPDVCLAINGAYRIGLKNGGQPPMGQPKNSCII